MTAQKARTAQQPPSEQQPPAEQQQAPAEQQARGKGQPRGEGQARTARHPATAAGPGTDRVALATAIRDAVLAVDGVAGLATGGPVEIATLYAGGKIPGVRLGDDLVEVHVRVDAVPMMPLAERIHTAVRDVLERAGAGRPVEVVVDDVDLAALTAPSGR
ncbi:hypothetical protein ACI2K4_05555 [Micromonospora sp. NPDC050397]|uniref:hypothetical protein n=1 Tax=Micromonospora sp. NPDC050397 TaxID=3364279 RepID=UPI0038503947